MKKKYQGGEPRLYIDPSSGGHDRYAWACACWLIQVPTRSHETTVTETEPGRFTITREDEKVDLRPIFYVFDYGMFEQNFWDAGVTGHDIAKRIGAIAKRHGIHHCHSDQRERLMGSAAIMDQGLTYHEHAFTSETKGAAVDLAKELLRDRLLVFNASCSSATQLRQQLIQFRQKFNKKSGAIKYEGKVDDLVSAAVLVPMHAEQEERISMSPISPAGKRIELP